MKIALIGASGFTGTAILNEALNRGHQVTAIARHPEKITVKNDHLTLKATDASNVSELAEALKGHDAIISCYNASWTSPSMYDDFMQGSEKIQEALQRSGVKRFMVMGGAGSLEIAPGVQLVDTPEFPADWKAGATAARDYLNILRKETELEWTFISPAINLHPGTRTGKFRLGKDNPVFDDQQQSNISAEDLAVAVVDALEQGKFIRERFTVGY